MFVTQSTTNIGDYFNDRTTSFWNRTGQRVCMFEHDGYGGQMIFKASADPNSSSPNLGGDANDKLTSLVITPVDFGHYACLA